MCEAKTPTAFAVSAEMGQGWVNPDIQGALSSRDVPPNGVQVPADQVGCVGEHWVLPPNN